MNAPVDPPLSETSSTELRSKTKNRWFTPVRLSLAGALLLLVLVVGGRWIAHRLTHVYEVDARVASSMYLISSELPGRLSYFPLEEGMQVSEGDVLARLEDSQAKLLLEELEVDIRRVEAQISELQTTESVMEGQLKSRLATAEAQLTAAQAAAQDSELQRQQAEDDLDRAGSLAAQKLIPARSLEQARTEYQQAVEALRRSEAQVVAARSERNEAQVNARQIEVIERQLDGLRLRRESLILQRDRQAKDLADRTIRAPISGVIDQTFVNPGEYVSPGQRLALLHDPEDVWVSANIKETEIDQVRVGQSVIVTVDAYGGQQFSGTVVRVGTSTTSQFALIPSPNPSGNFTKITQRLPVKITVDAASGVLKPGMMVEVDINVSDH